MAAPTINPVAIVLFLISSRFLLSTHVLQVCFSISEYKNRFIRQSGFPAPSILCHGSGILVNAWCIYAGLFQGKP